MISTRNLSLLPDVDCLRRSLQSMAMLDAILCPEWQFRCYSFNTAWAGGQQMGSMRNGSGDDLFAHFGPSGGWLKGFAHECPMTPYRENPKQVWPGVFDGVPAEFTACLREEAFSIEDVTFCIWRKYGDSEWRHGPVVFPADHPDPDGSSALLSPWDGRPETYHAWAENYYERDVSLAVVEHVFRHRPLNPEVIAPLNRDVSLSDLVTDADEIGYPQATEAA